MLDSIAQVFQPLATKQFDLLLVIYLFREPVKGVMGVEGGAFVLIVAVIGIESSFNPFAESTMGAQGLMQVIPRFHQDKVPDGAGEKALLDPVINIKVGTHVLEEAIRRRGGLIPGLQHYAGSSDPTGAYANKVLAEKHRLEQAARRASAAATRAAANSAPATPQA